MAILRKIALSLLLAVVVAVLTVAAIRLWNFRRPDSSLSRSANSPEIGERARVLEDRVEFLTKRVGDMELLVLLLLGASGLCALVLAGSSYLSGKSFARQADRTVAHMQAAIGAAMDDLRELQQQVQRSLDTIPNGRAAEVDAYVSGLWEPRVADIAARTAHWKGATLGTHEKLELVRLENEAAHLELAGGPRIARQMAGLYRNFAAIHATDDAARARFYLDRALVLSLPEPEVAAEIRYDLACWFAAARDYEQAIRELADAFQQHSRKLDARLSTDLEEGGKLYELAATPPFDRRLNDLLLNVSIP